LAAAAAKGISVGDGDTLRVEDGGRKVTIRVACIDAPEMAQGEERFGRDATVARLQELAAVEVEALTGILGSGDQVRMHSVGVELGQGS
jgi:endonuclease YncB( thermonuclease family)